MLHIYKYKRVGLTMLVVMALHSFSLMAQNTVTFTGSGNWSDAALWSGNTLPGLADNVVISNGSFCLADGNYTCNKLTLQGGTSGSNTTFKIGGTYTFQVTDQLTVNGSTGTDSTFQVVDVGEGTLDLSRCLLNSGHNLRVCEVVIRGGTLNVYELLHTYGNGNSPRNSIRFIGSGNLNIYGAWQSGFIVPGNGTVNYLGGDGQVIFSASNVDYPHLFIGGEGRKSLLSVTRVNGDLRIGSGTLDPGRFGLTARGETFIQAGTSLEDSDPGGTNTFVGKVHNLGTMNIQGSPVVMRGGLVNEGEFVSGLGTYTFNTNPQIIEGPSLEFHGNVTVNEETEFRVPEPIFWGNLQGTGKVVFSGENLRLKGNFNNSHPGFEVGNAMVTYDGTENQVIKAGDYHDLIISGTGIKGVVAATVVNNNLILRSGIFNFGAQNVTIKGEMQVEEDGTVIDNHSGGINVFEGPVTNKGNWIPSHNSRFAFEDAFLNTGEFRPTGLGSITFEGEVINRGIWDIQQASPFVFMGGFVNEGEFVSGTGMYTFNTNPQRVIFDELYFEGNVVVSSETVFQVRELGIAGNLTGVGGIVLRGEQFTIGGGFTNTGAFDVGTSTVHYNGQNAQTVKSTTYNDLIISGANMKTLGAVADSTIINNNLLVRKGEFNPGGRIIRIKGETQVELDGVFVDNSNNGSNIFEGLITIYGIFGNASNSPFIIKGGIVNYGQFISPGAGMFTFDTNTQFLEGNSMEFGGAVVVDSELDIKIPELTLNRSLSGTGKVILHENILNIGQNFNNTGEFEPGNSTVSFNGNANQSIKSTTYYNLHINGSGIKTLGGANEPAIVVNELVVAGGSLNLWTRDAIIKGTTHILSEGVLMDNNGGGTNIFEGRVTNHGTWNNTTTSPFTFRGGFINHGEFISTGGSTSFDTNPQVIEGNAMNFRGGVAVNSELDIRVPELTVNGNLSGTGKIILHDNILNLGNGFTNTGEFVAGTSMVNYYRASTQTIRSVPYYQLKISGSNRKSLSGPTTVQKALIVKGGSLQLAGHTLSIIKNNVL